jgi:hypothetical protein
VGNDDGSPDGLDVVNEFDVVPKGRPGWNPTVSSDGPIPGPSVGRYDGDCDVSAGGSTTRWLLGLSVGNGDGAADGLSLGRVGL